MRLPRYNPAAVRRTLRAAYGPAAISVMESMVGRRSWRGTQELGRKLGAFGFRRHRRYREAAMEHIRMAFGEEYSEDRVAEVAQGCLESTAMFFLEALRLTTMSPEEVREIARVEGAEYLWAAVEAGTGAVMFSGHIGNWDVGMVRLLYEGLPLVALSRNPRSPRLARKVMQIRERLDFPIIQIAEGAKGILRALRSNHLVPILPDRFAWAKGLTVPFFGRPTHCWHTPALMAQRTGCPIIPVFILRQPDGSFVVRLSPPLELQRSDDRDHDLWVNTTRCMAVLEGVVREYPEQYAWPYYIWRPGYEPPSPYPM